MLNRRNRYHRVLYSLLMVSVALGVMALLLAGSLLLQQRQPEDSRDPDAAQPVDGAVFLTTSTSTSTSASTTSTSSTVGTTTQPSMLQYDPAGHYVQPRDSDVPWNLLLVNDWNALPDDYDSGVDFVSAGDRNQLVDMRILRDLHIMLSDGLAYGIDVQSGYRPASQQSTLYWRKVSEYRSQGYTEEAAQQAAGTVVKRPGYSEHNCGLAVDLGGSGNFKLEADFADTPAYAWLIEHCAEYGFILRFPEGKEHITGVIYEPWHFRYVGKEAATYIMENGLCLEEYLELTEQ